MLGWSTQIRRSLAAVVAVTLTATGAVSVPAALGTPTGMADARSAIKAAPDRYEDRIVYWTNVKRKRHGLRPVRKGPCPDRFAESWSRHLAASGRFEHQDVSRMFSCGDWVRVAGENLARGTLTPRQVVNAWMRSPAHRANLLKRGYVRIGVGSYRSLDDGRMYTAQTFLG